MQPRPGRSSPYSCCDAGMDHAGRCAREPCIIALADALRIADDASAAASLAALATTRVRRSVCRGSRCAPYRVIHRLHHNNLYGELDPDTACMAVIRAESLSHQKNY